MENNSKDKVFHIGRYIFVWFAVIMVFVFIASTASEYIFRSFLLPIIRERVYIGEFHIESVDATRMVNYIFLMVMGSLLSFLPTPISVQILNTLAAVMKIDNSLPTQIIIPEGHNVLAEYLILGSALIATVLLSVLPYVTGGIWYAIVIRKKLREMVEYENEKSREYEAQRNLLLSDIAHDIKTPITSMSGYAKALSDGMVSPDKEKEYLDSIYKKSMRVNELINMMFEYIKLDSVGYHLDLKMADLSEICRQTAADMYQDFEEAGIELDINIPEEECICECDAIQIGRVMSNLLSNTIKYLNSGDKVSFCLEKTKKNTRDQVHYRVVVADSGVQIDDELAENIFVPFTRGDKTRSAKGGTGLGLSIAHKIAIMHGGELILDRSPDGEYSKAFILTL